MKAKKKPLDEKSPADFGADIAPRLKVLKTEEPGGRKAGVKVGSVSELVEKLRPTAYCKGKPVRPVCKWRVAALPVLTYERYAPLRFSHPTIFARA
ncbi:electron transfer flavosubunit beta domain protein [Brucella abortus]|nr:electron transfer flavosubunit beta domain protein [Brucella abortus]